MIARSDPLGGVMDIVYWILMAAFLLAALGLVAGCAALENRK